MRHVVCIIHRNHLTIERDNREIGTVKTVDGEPTILLDSYAVEGRQFPLSFTDLEIIQDNWNAMQELGGEIDKVSSMLPKDSKLSVWAKPAAK